LPTAHQRELMRGSELIFTRLSARPLITMAFFFRQSLALLFSSAPILVIGGYYVESLNKSQE
jgi:hypothetical protein